MIWGKFSGNFSDDSDDSDNSDPAPPGCAVASSAHYMDPCEGMKRLSSPFRRNTDGPTAYGKLRQAISARCRSLTCPGCGAGSPMLFPGGGSIRQRTSEVRARADGKNANFSNFSDNSDKSDSAYYMERGEGRERLSSPFHRGTNSPTAYGKLRQAISPWCRSLTCPGCGAGSPMLFPGGGSIR